MIYTRVRTYYAEGEKQGKWTGLDMLYPENNQVAALASLRKHFPEHKACIAVAEPFDPEKDIAHKELFNQFLRCEGYILPRVSHDEAVAVELQGVTK